ncbi:MAG: hypothetical protein B7Z41_05370 [Rhizobiales bacterium 12-66-7]|nr:MAG: hypothetical protein B7Z41_05370 [Rhizobiales bacterium 12-66-7]
MTRHGFSFRPGRLIAALSLCAATLLGAAQASAAEPYRPRIFAGYPGWDHLMPFLDEELGIWKAYGIDPVFDSGSSQRVSQVLQTGEWDAAYTQIATALTYRARGLPIVIAGASSYGSATVVARKDLASEKDIKNFGIVRQLDTMHLLAAEHILPSHGIDPKGVKFIQVPPPEAGIALERKDIDAYYVYEPYASQMIEKGQAKLLWDWREVFANGQIYRNALVLNEDFIKAHPEEARKVVWAHLAALDIIQKDPKRAAEVLARRAKTTVDQAMLGYAKAGWDQRTIPEDFLKLTEDDLIKWKVLRAPIDLKAAVDFSLQQGYRPPDAK